VVDTSQLGLLDEVAFEAITVSVGVDSSALATLRRDVISGPTDSERD
jgi:hypothetical protein